MARVSIGKTRQSEPALWNLSTWHLLTQSTESLECCLAAPLLQATWYLNLLTGPQKRLLQQVCLLQA